MLKRQRDEATRVAGPRPGADPPPGDEKGWGRAPVARGLRDVLPKESLVRRRIVAAALDRLFSGGYGEVATPTFERYEDLVRETGDVIAGELFRFFDADGTLMALRPEMTTPIARVVAQRMGDVAGPIRLCYAAPVFREEPTLLGQAREFIQVGAELVDSSGPEADAEVIALACEVASSAGVEGVAVGVGRVDLIRAVLGDAGVSDAASRPLLDALGAGDLVTFDRELETALAGAGAGFAGPVRAVEISALMRLDGGVEALAEARRLAGPSGFGILADLEATLAAVDRRLGYQPARAHFGMVRSFDYYTGLVFEVHASGLGTALGGGGRYDDLLAEFGAPRAAAGFALGLERLMQATSGDAP